MYTKQVDAHYPVTLPFVRSLVRSSHVYVYVYDLHLQKQQKYRIALRELPIADETDSEN